MNKLQKISLGLLACFLVAIMLIPTEGQVTKTTVTTLVPVFNTGQFNQASGTLYVKDGVLLTNAVLVTPSLGASTATSIAAVTATLGSAIVTNALLGSQATLTTSLLVSATSANNNPMVRLTSAAGLPQLVLEDLDATDAQEPFLYFQSANNASAGRGYIGFADRSGTNLSSNADILALKPTGLELYGALTVDNVTVTNAATVGSLVSLGVSRLDGAVTVDSLSVTNNLTLANTTASLPLFTDANKVAVTKTIANALIALGIDRGTATIAADGTVTNTFNITFSVAPVVVSTISAGAGLTNRVSAITETNCVFTTGTETGTVQWIAVGAP